MTGVALSRPERQVPLLSVLAALIAFAMLQAAAMSKIGWVFEYPLDDVYIHLAMAEQMARGGYGVNAGEYASAASSPLYPVLLMPLAGQAAGRWLPLVWNLIGLVGSAYLWGRIVVEAGLTRAGPRAIGLVVAIAGPVALNFFGVAFTGMEHSLHTAASLMIVLGLWRLMDQDRLSWLLWAGILLSPLMRLEGLALASLAAVAIWWLKGARPGGTALALALLPAIGFAVFLMSLGLQPLPSSVMAKLVAAEDIDMPLLARFIDTFRINVGKGGGLILAAGAGVALALVALTPRADSRIRAFGTIIALAAFGHLVLGQIGWMKRYEGYMIAVLGAGLVILAARRGTGFSALVVAGAVGAGVTGHWTSWVQDFPQNPRGIYLQPAQSARFAKDFARVPVAVNDLGLVSWQNPDYVLDLWGLASDEARHARLRDPRPGWAAPLAERRDVALAMIFDVWLAEAVGPGWVRLGTLKMRNPLGYLGDDEVAYYATSPAAVPGLVSALRDWMPTLPGDAYFEFAEGIE